MVRLHTSYKRGLKSLRLSKADITENH